MGKIHDAALAAAAVSLAAVAVALALPQTQSSLAIEGISLFIAALGAFTAIQGEAPPPAR